MQCIWIPVKLSNVFISFQQIILNLCISSPGIFSKGFLALISCMVLRNKIINSKIDALVLFKESLLLSTKGVYLRWCLRQERFLKSYVIPTRYVDNFLLWFFHIFFIVYILPKRCNTTALAFYLSAVRRFLFIFLITAPPISFRYIYVFAKI